MQDEKALSALRVLVVDDHGPTRAIIERILRAAGVERIGTAGSGAEALSALEAASMDLVISDHNMPEMEGLELVRTLRKDARFEKLRILIVSGYEDVAKPALAAGANGVLLKPITAASLLAAMENAMA